VASADSGPLRSRYGGVRDLVVGMSVALSDGTRAKSGGKVIKNVAGYDLAKLFAGSFGTLGAILEVAVRLHPRPPATATAIGRTGDPAALAAAASTLTHAPLEHSGLDVLWEAGAGAVLARFGGVDPASKARAAAQIMGGSGLDTDVHADDDELWGAQRERQRARPGRPDTILRVSALQTDLAELLATAARYSASLVGRAPLGLSWLRVENPDVVPDALADLRRTAATVVLDAPAAVRERVDSWGPRDDAVVALMRRVKAGFDPSGACAPGVLV
jgi:glycolate oxidase FAD binding subunit